MKLNKILKLRYEKKKLDLEIKKQEYEILKHALELKHQYHPLKLASELAFRLLGDENIELNVDLTALPKNERKKIKRKMQTRSDVQSLLLNLFTFISSVFSPLTDRIAERYLESKRKYIIGKDDM